MKILSYLIAVNPFKVTCLLRAACHWNRPIARDKSTLEPLPLVWSILNKFILRDQTLACHPASGLAQQSLWSNVWLRMAATRVCPIEDIKFRLNHLSVKQSVNCPVHRVLWDCFRKQGRKGGLRVSRSSHQPLRPCFRSKPRNMLTLGDEAAMWSISHEGPSFFNRRTVSTTKIQQQLILFFKLGSIKHGRKTTY